jgi:hypothetical protein
MSAVETAICFTGFVLIWTGTMAFLAWRKPDTYLTIAHIIYSFYLFRWKLSDEAELRLARVGYSAGLLLTLCVFIYQLVR